MPAAKPHVGAAKTPYRKDSASVIVYPSAPDRYTLMKDHTPLDRPRSILDPIHGLIRFTDEEFKVVEHSVFQRLGKIKQNGLLYFVFPGARHTRFEHSLGVLFVADAMLRSLVSNSRVAAKKGAATSIGGAQGGQAVDLSELSDDDSKFLYRIARLAALSHDLGHGPFSHTFDKFALSNATLRKLMADSAVSALDPLKDIIISWKAVNEESPVKHEIMSCVFFAQAWSEIGEPEAALAVAAAVLGPKTYDRLTDSRMKRLVPLVHDVIASAPADADRMDYMERDSRSIGVTYGLFDRNRVLKTLLCYKEVTTSGERLRLGLKRSGLRAVENLMQARFQLYTQVFYHKTNGAIQLMLEEIATFARKRGLFVVAGDTVRAVAGSYDELDDEHFLRTLRGKVEGPFRDITEINSLAEQIKRRKLWKRIDECETEREAETLKAHLERLHGTAVASSLKIDTQDPEATKDLAEGARLLERDAGGVYSTSGAPSILAASKLIQSLQEAEQRAIRLYLAKCDSRLASTLRRSAWSFSSPRETH